MFRHDVADRPGTGPASKTECDEARQRKSKNEHRNGDDDRRSPPRRKHRSQENGGTEYHHFSEFCFHRVLRFFEGILNFTACISPRAHLVT